MIEAPSSPLADDVGINTEQENERRAEDSAQNP